MLYVSLTPQTCLCCWERGGFLERKLLVSVLITYKKRSYQSLQDGRNIFAQCMLKQQPFPKTEILSNWREVVNLLKSSICLEEYHPFLIKNKDSNTVFLPVKQAIQCLREYRLPAFQFSFQIYCKSKRQREKSLSIRWKNDVTQHVKCDRRMWRFLVATRSEGLCFAI